MTSRRPGFGEGEDSHHPPGPVTATSRQRLPDRVPVLFPGRPAYAVSRLRRGDKLVRPGGQRSQQRRTRRDSQVEREHGRFHDMPGAELLDFSAGDHDASYPARWAG